MHGKRMLVTLAALAGSLTVSEALAQGRWELPSGGGWAPTRCVQTHAVYLAFECGDADMFIKARTPIEGDDHRRCCDLLEYTRTGSVTVGVDSKFKACGAEWGVRVEGTYSFTTTNRYAGHVPCGCVQLYYEQPFRLRKKQTHYTRCYATGNPNRPWETVEWTEVVILKDKVPFTGGVEPYYHQNPSNCSGCTDGRPDNPATPVAPLWSPNIPGGFHKELPTARPQPEAVPWDPSRYGPADFDSLMPADGSGKQVTIDLQAAWKPRQITSVLELNLFETGWILQSLEALRMDNGAGDATSVEVLIADGVRLNGRLFDLSKQLYKYADAMVNAKSYGDFNEDGERNAQDLQLLQDAVINIDDMSELRLYDVNGDNDVNQNDLTKWLELVGT